MALFFVRIDTHNTHMEDERFVAVAEQLGSRTQRQVISHRGGAALRAAVGGSSRRAAPRRILASGKGGAHTIARNPAAPKEGILRAGKKTHPSGTADPLDGKEPEP